MSGREFWLWVWLERFSWVVALAGFPFLWYQVYVLQREQRRLADELTRRAEIDFGFLVDGEPTQPALKKEDELKVDWPQGEELSKPVKVTFVAVNRGARTARNLVFNLRFPPAGSGLAEGPNVVRLSDGSLKRIETTEYIHPGAVQYFTMDLRIPVGLKVLPVEATVVMDDTPESRFSVSMKIRSRS